MRAPVPTLASVALVAVLAGCAGGGTEGNPNLLAPKLVVADAPGGTVVFVHSAYGERLYDRITILVNNATIAEENTAFSAEETVPDDAFFLEVTVWASETSFHYAAALAQEDKDSMRVVPWSASDGWGAPHGSPLPFTTLIDYAPEERS